MGTIAPDPAQGKALYEGTQSFYDHDDAGDPKSGGVYSHNEFLMSGTEAASWTDYFRYLNTVLSDGGTSFKIINNTGASIGKSTIVTITGYDTSNTAFEIGKAVNNDNTLFPVGALTDALTDGSTGTMYFSATVENIDTSGGSVDDPVYLSSTAGAYTLVKPTTNGEDARPIGFITASDIASGSILFAPRLFQPDHVGLVAEGSLTVKDGATTVHDIEATGTTVWNEPGSDLDMRWEGDTDQNLMYLDAGSDAVIFGSNAPIGSEKLRVNGASVIGGDGTNYTSAETDGTIVFNGNATCWEDVNINPVNSVRGVASAPDVITIPSTTLEVAAFDAGTEEEITFGFEIPHAQKLGSDISCHVHWSPTNTDTGVVRWGLEYAFFQEGTGAVTTSTTIYINDTAGGTAWVKQTADFAAITPPASELGLQFCARLFRDASDAADTYNADAAITTTFGAHYELDMSGSRQITTK